MEDSKVAVILEDLRSQFRVFGEGLQMLNEKVDRVDNKVDIIDKRVDTLDYKVNALDKKVDALDKRLERHEIKNEEENRLLMQMIRELSEEQKKLKKAK
jgi:chromosome segregation ATPase